MLNQLTARARRRLSRGRNAAVLSTTALSPRLRLLRLGGDALRDVAWAPGHKVKLALPSGAKASYTPSRVDPDAGWMEVVFHLHDGDGPLANWGRDAAPGDPVTVLGPKPSLRAAPPSATWGVFLGDETTAGLAVALLASLPDGAPRLGALELDRDDLGAVAALNLPLAPLPRNRQHGDALRAWLAQNTLPDGPGIVWLSGHAQTTLDLRYALLKRGVAPDIIAIKPYWSDRGHLHRKMLERTL